MRNFTVTCYSRNIYYRLEGSSAKSVALAVMRKEKLAATYRAVNRNVVFIFELGGEGYPDWTVIG